MNIDHVLNQWRDKVLSELEDQLEYLFDASSDVMLEYAEKAQSDHVRGRFYEALREIRLRRLQVGEHMRAGLERAAFRFDSAPVNGSSREEVLSLVDKNDVEQGLAIQTITERAERDHERLIRSLSLRLAAVSGGRPVSTDDLPLGPRQLTTQFVASATLLQMEHEALLALYALFERFVLQDCMEPLAELDTKLAELGVLPNLKPYSTEIKNVSGSGSPSARAADAERHGDKAGAAGGKGGDGPGSAAGGGEGEAMPLGDEVLLRIRDLLATRRAKRRTGSVVGAPAPVREVDTAIDARPGSPAAAPADQVMMSAQALREVSNALSNQRDQLRERIGEERVAADIDDIIEIIGAIFEAMLNEPDLPSTVKALLSHLHTPFMKYAVSDPGLLDEEDHPARGWLDDMIRAGSEWVDPGDLEIGLYPWMSNVVSELIQSVELTRTSFEQLRGELAAQLLELGDKQQRVEARATEFARGQARLEAAQQLADTELEKLLHAHPAARVAEGFLKEAWSDYLALVLLRGSNDVASADAKEAIRLGERICTTVVMTARAEHPDMVAIDELHASLDAQVGHLIPHLQSRINHFVHYLKHDDTSNTHYSKHIKPAIRRKPHEPDNTEPLTPEESRIATRLTQLPAGTRFWRRTTGPDRKAHETTIRLVWFNKYTTKFMFVDLSGQNAGMVPIKELASDIVAGRARILEEHKESFFARALRAFQTVLGQQH